jgi:hypothetical protein
MATHNLGVLTVRFNHLRMEKLNWIQKLLGLEKAYKQAFYDNVTVLLTREDGAEYQPNVILSAGDVLTLKFGCAEGEQIPWKLPRTVGAV